jgi:CHASE3 domain sensor protein
LKEVYLVSNRQDMPFTLTPRISSGYIIAFILLLTSYFMMFFTIQKLVKGTGVIEHTYNVVNKLGELKGEIVDVETGARGYVITQDPRFFKTFNSGKRNIPSILQELRNLTADNTKPQNNLNALSHWIKIKMDFMAKGLNVFQTNGFKITEDMTIARNLVEWRWIASASI